MLTGNLVRVKTAKNGRIVPLYLPRKDPGGWRSPKACS